MPKKPIEWSKCIIYKIWKDDNFYVGSTTDLASRKKQHKCCCNNEKNKCNIILYQTIREKGGWDAWQMTPLEEYTECQSRNQARIREEEWRIKIQANLNMIKAYCSKEELQIKKIEINKNLYQKNLKQNSNFNKDRYQQNKEKNTKKFDCQCGGKYMNCCKARHERSQKHQTYLNLT